MIYLIFLESIRRPLPKTIIPRKIVSLISNSYFLISTYNPTLRRRFSTYLTYLRYIKRDLL